MSAPMCRYEPIGTSRSGLSTGTDRWYAWSRTNAMRVSLVRPLAPNSALLTDTYSSPLRAQRGAAKRER